MGKAQRQKGHAWERECAKSLRPLDELARRKLEYNPMDCDGVDIQTSLPLRVQCKAGRSMSMAIKGWFEAKKGSRPGIFPVCAFKPNRLGRFAVLDWDHFLEIFSVYVRGV